MSKEDALRLRRLEQNFELLRRDLLSVKSLAQEFRQAVDMHDTQRETEMGSLRQEVESLRIENTRLREQLGETEEVTPALPWPGKPTEEA